MTGTVAELEKRKAESDPVELRGNFYIHVSCPSLGTREGLRSPSPQTQEPIPYHWGRLASFLGTKSGK